MHSTHMTMKDCLQYL